MTVTINNTRYEITETLTKWKAKRIDHEMKSIMVLEFPKKYFGNDIENIYQELGASI